MTINDLLRLKAEADAQREAVNQEVAVLEGKCQEKLDEENKAETAEALLQCQTDLAKIQAELTIAKRKQEKIEQPFSDTDVRAAWSEYVSDYNQRMAAGIKKYQAKLEALATEYGKLIELQGEALKNRAICGRFLNIRLTRTQLLFPDLYRDKQYEDAHMDRMEMLPDDQNILGCHGIKNGNLDSMRIAPKTPDDLLFLRAKGFFMENSVDEIVCRHQPV